MKQKNKKNQKSQPKAGSPMAENVKGQRLRKRGFSLVESLIAVFIFSLVAAMLAGAFSGFLKNYANAKKAQRSAESAQYAMNLMAKSLRTSSLITTNFPLDTFDYSQGKCIRYGFTANKLQVATTTDVSPADPSACTWATATSYADLTSADIQGALVTATPSTDPVFGKITIALNVKEVGQTTSALPIQMTVSLRQY